MKEENRMEIEKILKYKFKNKELLTQAFTRSSCKNENGRRSSELLEFLGDRVIEYVVTKIFFDSSIIVSRDNLEVESKYSEGDLTTIKKLIVENKNFAFRIGNLELESYLITTKIKKIPDSYKSDLLESVIGAIALDSNYDETELYKIVKYLLEPETYINYSDLSDYLDFEKFISVKKIKYKKEYIKNKDEEEEGLYKTTLKSEAFDIDVDADTQVDSTFKAFSAALSKLKKQ